MRNFGDKDLVPLDLELERIVRRIRKGNKEQTEFEHKSMENVEDFREGEEVDIQSTRGESLPQFALPMED